MHQLSLQLEPVRGIVSNFIRVSKPKMKYTVRDLRADFPDDDACLEWLVNFLYPDGITCKKCEETTKHYKIKGRKVYSCMKCGSHVSPTAGTIFHKSRTPLTDWFYAVYLMSATRSGVSAKQIERQLGCTYKTAWRMMHQIRKMMVDDMEKQLGGEVEIDETFIHPNTFKRSSARRNFGRDARRTGEAVFGIVQRNGRARVWHVRTIGSRVLLPIIRQNVAPGTLIHTDGYQGYKPLPMWGFEHKTTEHSKHEYFTPDSSTQNVENLWSHLKRGIKNAYRHVGKGYVQAYANEFAFRYSHRNDFQPMFWAIMNKTSNKNGLN